MKKIHLTESERQKILSLHGSGGLDIVFTDVMTQDEKYVIFMDHLIEVETKTNLGNVWENSDNLFFFFNHLYKTSDLPREIIEESTQVLGRNLLSESNSNITHLKPIFKQYLKEGIWDTVKKGAGYFGNWVKDTAVSTVTGITDTVVSGAKGLWQGIKDAGVAISKGDFKEVLKIIGRGFLWVGRKIRAAMYHPVGMIIDAILVATGIGKVAQVVVWAIVVCVDIYEFITGDYEEKGVPLWMRILFFGVDLLGLFFAGAAAKAGRSAIELAVKGVKTEAEMGSRIMKSPTLMGLIEKMVSALKGLPAKLSSFAKSLGKGFFSEMFATVLKGASKFIETALKSIASMFKGPGAKEALKQVGLLGAFGIYGEYSKEQAGLQQLKAKKLAQTQNAQLATAISKKDADYSQMIA